MAFGDSSSLLDNFNRANEDPMNSNWSHLVSNHKVVSNQCTIITQNTNTVSMYNVATYGADCEAYISLPTVGAYSMALILRATTLTWATLDGYYVYADTGDNEIEIYRIDNGTATKLGVSVSHTWANGHKLGGEIIGSTIKGYVDTGSGWTEMISRTDATYSGAGYLGIRSYGVTTMRYDDFYGGTISAAVNEIGAQYSIINQFFNPRIYGGGRVNR